MNGRYATQETLTWNIAVRLDGRIIGLLLCISCTACSKGLDYHYVEIESKDFQIIERGRSDVGKSAAYFASHEEMPVLYLLERSNYVIMAEIPLKERNAYMIFSAQTKTSSPLIVSGNVENNCFGSFLEPGRDFIEPDWPKQGVVFWWTQLYLSDCRSQPMPIDVPIKIRLELSNLDGEYIGEEQVTISVRNNGRYYNWASI